MILHPGVLALLAGSACVLLLLAVACWHAVAIVRRWDFESSSAGQLDLERRTHLVSSVVAYALGFQLFSTFLFVHAVDDVHTLLVGAMCATGSLNANPVGWISLSLKLVLLFASAFWLALNALDRSAEDLPLCRAKFALLLALAPLVAADFWFQARYFLGLRLDVITSCCGSLFTAGGEGVASTLSGLPALPTLWAFYAGAAAFFAVGAWCLLRPSPAARYALFALSAGMLVVSTAAIVSAISLYVYESPIHHCPFDILQSGYHYVGYPLYLSLLFGVFFGALPGATEPLRKIPSLSARLEPAQRRWLVRSALFFGLFVALATSLILSSHLTLFGG